MADKQTVIATLQEEHKKAQTVAAALQKCIAEVNSKGVDGAKQIVEAQLTIAGKTLVDVNKIRSLF